MTAHKRLPNRRHAETFELTVGGLRYVCTVGRFVTAGSASCFFGTTKSISTADTNARDAAACRRCITTALVKIHARATH